MLLRNVSYPPLPPQCWKVQEGSFCNVTESRNVPPITLFRRQFNLYRTAKRFWFVPTTPVNCPRTDTKKAPWPSPRLSTVLMETAKRLLVFRRVSTPNTHKHTDLAGPCQSCFAFFGRCAAGRSDKLRLAGSAFLHALPIQAERVIFSRLACFSNAAHQSLGCTMFFLFEIIFSLYAKKKRPVGRFENKKKLATLKFYI